MSKPLLCMWEVKRDDPSARFGWSYFPCGNPATHRAGGNLACDEHADRFRELYCGGVYPVLPERPDPRGVRLLVHVVCRQVSGHVLKRILKERVGCVWRHAAETAEAVYALAVSAVSVVVYSVLTVLGLLLVIPAIPFEFFQALYLVFTNPDAVRRAFRVMDGLPEKPDSHVGTPAG